MFNFLADNIAELISEKATEFINKYVDFAVDAFKSIPWWLQAIILLFVIILLVLGIIRFIAKSWKLLLVLVVLAAIAFAVYFIFIRGKNTQAVETVFGVSKTLLNFL